MAHSVSQKKTMSTVIDAAEAHTEQIGLIVHGLASLKGAMAQWRDTAQNARLAEVMGAIPRHLYQQPNQNESVSDNLWYDTEFTESMTQAGLSLYSPEVQNIHAAVQNHIKWILDEAHAGIQVANTV